MAQQETEREAATAKKKERVQQRLKERHANEDRTSARGEEVVEEDPASPNPFLEEAGNQV